MTTSVIVLDGTVQTTYQGSTYQTPIALYVPVNYPLSAPYAYLKPTPDMYIVDVSDGLGAVGCCWERR